MVHNFWFMMSLSGSVILLLYILTYPVARRYFSLAWRYRILKIAIMFYLIPFPVFLSWIRTHLSANFPQVVADKFHVPKYFLNTEYGIYKEGGSVYVSSKMKGMLILLAVLGILSCAIVLLHISRYRKASRICLKYSYLPVGQKWQEYFQELKTGLNIKRKVRLFCSEYCTSPVTTGVIFPTVIIPPWNAEERKFYQDVIRHELVHIKHRDLQIKFLGMLVIAVHWFNPFAHILFYEISNISEMYCDSVVLRGKEEKERKAYAELLLKFASEKPHTGMEYMVGIMGGNSKRAFKRRILEMKTVKKNKAFLSVVMMAVICMFGSLTVFAYNGPSNIEPFERTDSQDWEFDYQFTLGEVEIEMEDIPYEHFFTDDSGNVYQLIKEEDVSRASCAHHYVAGKETKHSKKQGGGCTVTYYEAKRCSNCGNVIRGKEINTVTYSKCPH